MRLTQAATKKFLEGKRTLSNTEEMTSDGGTRRKRCKSCQEKHVREDDRVLAINNLKLVSILCKKCNKYVRFTCVIEIYWFFRSLCYFELITHGTHAPQVKPTNSSRVMCITGDFRFFLEHVSFLHFVWLGTDD